jgi:hypothetical protein
MEGAGVAVPATLFEDAHEHDEEDENARLGYW